MNPNVTFFHKQDQPRRSTWRTNVTLGGPHRRTITLYVCARNDRLDTTLRSMERGRPLAEDEYRRLLDEGRADLILEEKTDANGSEVRCRAAGEELPDEVLLLRPGYPAAFRPLEEKLRIEPGGHMIVPVDKGAQKELSLLLGNLRRFSPDIESLVLNTIWRPGLERRVARLEKRMEIPEDRTHAEPTSPVKRWVSRALGYGKSTLDVVTRYAPLLTAALVLVLLLGDSRLLSWGGAGAAGTGAAGTGAGGPGSESAPTSEARQGGGVEESTDPKGDGETRGDVVAGVLEEDETQTRDPEDEITAQLRHLDEALAGLSEATHAAKLYSSHFASPPVRSTDDLAGNQGYAWGLVKLLYLQKNGAADMVYDTKQERMDRVLGSAGQRSWGRVMLERMRPELSPRQKSALALVTCRAFSRTRPGLPGDPRDPPKDWKHDSVDLEGDCEFDDAEMELAADGLRAMNDELVSPPPSEGE